MPAVAGDGVKVGTFLGNYGRRYYGQGPAPKRLNVIWKVDLGSGMSSGKKDSDPPSKWAGSGWTGQPSVVVDGGKTYLLASSYEYKLRKIDAETGEVAWAYQYDDIIKSSPSVFKNPAPTGADDRYIVVAGSRRGYPKKLDDPTVAPVRAVTFGSGKELWRLPVPQTRSYSRDADGSGFFFDGTFYQGVESGWFYALDPLKTTAWAEGKKPVVQHQTLLLGDQRAEAHGSDLVLESSPSAVGMNLYIASGAGHVYGLRRPDLKVVWDYYIGSDLDGTPVPTKKGLLLQGVEKQYIKGKGGMLALDPTKPPDKATVWFFPTGNRELGDWKGGIVGSAAVNDSYNEDGQYPALCAFSAIDGYLYVVSQDVMSDATVKGPNLRQGPQDAGAGGEDLERRGDLDADHRGGVAGLGELRPARAPLRHRLHAGRGGRPRRAPEREPRRGVLDGRARGARPVLHQRRLRVDARAVERARVRRLSRRVSVLPRRQVRRGRG